MQGSELAYRRLMERETGGSPVNNALLYTIIGLAVIIVAVLLILHFTIGGGTGTPTPTPTSLAPFRLPI
jgi:hypothetical protein